MPKSHKETDYQKFKDYPWWTYEQVMIVLSVSRSTLDLYCRQGYFTIAKLPNRELRIRSTEVMDFMNSRVVA